MCRRQTLVVVPHKNGTALIGVAVGALVNHHGERTTLALGDNRVGRLCGQTSLHDHRCLRSFTLKRFRDGAVRKHPRGQDGEMISDGRRQVMFGNKICKHYLGGCPRIRHLGLGHEEGGQRRVLESRLRVLLVDFSCIRMSYTPEAETFTSREHTMHQTWWSPNFGSAMTPLNTRFQSSW